MCDCHEGELRHAKGRKVTSEPDKPQGHQQGGEHNCVRSENTGAEDHVEWIPGACPVEKVFSTVE